ncbi:MAG: Ig-like domain-containing protein, partial [Candidatus Thermoplasmatota archaeon]|nr:Ig-like domain-containing protein [Candidatus Thermoplasmatota archaeon]
PVPPGEPTVTIHAPEDGTSVNGTVRVQGNATDPRASLRKVEVRVDQGPWHVANGTTNWSYRWDTRDVPGGLHRIYARAWNGHAGSEVVSVDVTVERERANMLPTVAIEEPVDGDTVKGNLIARGFSQDRDGDVAWVEVRIPKLDQGWIQAQGAPRWDHTFSREAFEPGTYELQARAWDGQDYGPSKSASFLVPEPEREDEPPTVTIHQPQAGTSLTGNVTIHGTAKDAEGPVAKVEVRIDHGPWHEAQGTASWTWTWPTREDPPGPHTIRVRALDASGQAAYAEASVHVGATDDDRREGDHVSPKERVHVALIQPAYNATVTGTIHVRGTISDPTPGPQPVTVEVRLDDGPWQPAKVQGNELFRVALDTTGLAPGPHVLIARGTDGLSMSPISTRPLVLADEPLEAQEAPTPVPGPTATAVLALLTLAALARTTARQRR